jgi:hypothetical protein
MIDDEVVQNVCIAQVIKKMGSADWDRRQRQQQQDKSDEKNFGFQCHEPNRRKLLFQQDKIGERGGTRTLDP